MTPKVEMNQRDIPALMGRGYPPGRTQRPAVIAPLLRTFDGIAAQGLSAIQDRTPHEEILITNCEASTLAGFRQLLIRRVNRPLLFLRSAPTAFQGACASLWAHGEGVPVVKMRV